MDPKKSSYLKVGTVLGALAFTYVMAAYVVPKALVTMTKAAPATKISINDTKIIGEKILARADGKDKCKVDVFVLDKNLKGVANKEVVLEGLDLIEPNLSKSDNDGKATFEIRSSVEGTFALKATVGGSPIQRELKVTFRN